MTAHKYKTKKGIKWLSSVRYTDIEGKRKQAVKRGFNTRREALAYESKFLREVNIYDIACTLQWSEFVDLYFEDVKPKLSPSTISTKTYRIKNHIGHAFTLPVNEITPAIITDWLNSLLENNDLSLRYIKSLYIELKAVFNHAERIYNLSPNPVKKVPPPTRKEHKKEMQFWTYEEFNSVIEHIDDLKAKTAIILLFYSGIRKGELLALKWSDLKGNELSINKTLHRINGKTIITPPKSQSSNRTILLPGIAVNALNEWENEQYSDDSFIFEWDKTFLERAIRQGSESAGVKRIRVHDLRHSHVSYLISLGANINLISKRLGHAKVSMTLDVYSHLYPDDEQTIINLIDNNLITKNSVNSKNDIKKNDSSE